MFAHLFDYDNVYINKLEAIIDRFIEICDIKTPQNTIVRDRLINMISFDMLLTLAKKLPKEEQGILTTLKDSPSLENVNSFKAKFQQQDVLNAFHDSAKAIISDKINVVRPRLSNDKAFELDSLVAMIGKF